MVVSKSDYKRLFIQAMLQRRWASETTVKLLFMKCIEATRELNPALQFAYNERNFATDSGESFVAEVNRDLQKFDLRLSSTKDECTGETLWALINTKQDAATMLATEYSPVEISYFKLVVEQIMLSHNEVYSIPATAALREVSQLQGKGITKSEAEHLLSSFVAKGWLMKSKRGRYSLAPRSLLELQSYFRETYPDEYQECTNCLEPMTKGVACRTENCAVRMHTYCYEAWVRARRDRPLECPQCRKSWKEADVRKVGEEGVKGDHVHRRVTRDGDEDEEDEAEEEEEVEMEEAGDEEAEPSQETEEAAEEAPVKKGGRKKTQSQRVSNTPEAEDEPSQTRSSRRTSRRK